MSQIQRTLTRSDSIFHSEQTAHTLVITSYETWQNWHGPQGRKEWMKREKIRDSDGIPSFGMDTTMWPTDLSELFVAVLCDEAHFFKNPDSSQS